MKYGKLLLVSAICCVAAAVVTIEIIPNSYTCIYVLSSGSEWFRWKYGTRLVNMTSPQDASRTISVLKKSKSSSVISATTAKIIQTRREYLFPYLVYVVTNSAEYDRGTQVGVLSLVRSLDADLALPVLEVLTNSLSIEDPLLGGNAVAYLQEKQLEALRDEGAEGRIVTNNFCR